MIVAIYIRVRSNEQVSNFNIEAQAKACQQFAEEHGWTVGDIYTDVGRSAKDANRPQFRRMMADAKARRFEVILTRTLDRFSRSLADILIDLRDLESCGVNLISVTEPLDFASLTSKRMVTLLAAFAEVFRDNSSVEAAGLHALFAPRSANVHEAMPEPIETESEHIDHASRDLHPREQ